MIIKVTGLLLLRHLTSFAEKMTGAIVVVIFVVVLLDGDVFVLCRNKFLILVFITN